MGDWFQKTENTCPKSMILNFKDNQGVQRTDSLKYQYFPSDFFVIGWQWGQHPRRLQGNLVWMRGL